MGSETIAGIIANALVLSSAYILVAIGFALIFGVMNILNFAHGAIYMVGAYVAYYVGVTFGLEQWVAVLIAAVVVGLFGLFLGKFLFLPFQGDFDRSLMVSLALIILLQTAGNVTVGAQIRTMPSVLPGVMTIAGVSLAKERVVAFAASVVLLLGLIILVQKTKLGKEMQAIAQDRGAASLQGINNSRVSLIAFSLAAGLAAVAGGLVSSMFGLSTYMGDTMLVKVIAIVILAGMGSTGGIFVSGLIIGCLDAILPSFLGGTSGDIASSALIILILLIRPQGLFGSRT